jgi:hypothetical protein
LPPTFGFVCALALQTGQQNEAVAKSPAEKARRVSLGCEVIVEPPEIVTW